MTNSSTCRRGSRAPRTGRLAFTLPLLLAAAPLLGESGSPVPMTLSDVLEAAAEGSHASAAARLDVESARESTKKARAAYLPSFGVSGGWFGRDHEVVATFDTPFGALAAETTQKNFFVGDVTLSQLLWDGGRRSSALKASRIGEEAAAMRGRADVVGAQLEALSAYLRILVLKAQRRVVEQRVANLEGHLREAQDLYDQGLVARNDLLGTEVRLRTVKDQLGQIENGIAVSAEGLNRLMGRDPGEPLLLPDSLPNPPELTESLREMKRRLPDRSPALLALAARLGAESQLAELRRRDDLPSLFARASHEYQQNQYLAYPQSNVLFVGLAWSAFDGGARDALRRQADLAVEKTEREIREARRTFEIELDRTFRDYEQALREADTARSNTVAAEENLRIVEDQYRAGLGRTTEVLDAESVLAETRFAVASQHYTAYLRQGSLLGAAGLDLAKSFAQLHPKEP